VWERIDRKKDLGMRHQGGSWSGSGSGSRSRFESGSGSGSESGSRSESGLVELEEPFEC
jgi:hypothetical protein